MYINNVHILFYVGALVLGIISGEFTNWCSHRLPEYKKVFSTDIFNEYRIKKIKLNPILMVVNAVINIALLYFLGLSVQGGLANINLVKYIVLTPMLLSAFIIDYKHQIIPNRLNLTIFELGLIFTFFESLFNINAGINSILRYVCRSWNIFNYNIYRFSNCWQGSNGVWRCQIYGSHWIVFWII